MSQTKGEHKQPTKRSGRSSEPVKSNGEVRAKGPKHHSFNPKASSFVPTPGTGGPMFYSPMVPMMVGMYPPPPPQPHLHPVQPTMYPPPNPYYPAPPMTSISAQSLNTYVDRGMDGYVPFNTIPVSPSFPPYGSGPAAGMISSEPPIPSQCVWVGNVAPDVSEDQFRSEFERYGDVTQVRMFRKSKCAFVTFQTAEEALKALELEGKRIGSMKLTLNVGIASRHLWIGNVGEDVSEEDLAALFRPFGTVESTRVLRANKSGFVNFMTAKNALKAAEKLNGTTLKGNKLAINFQWTDMNRRNTGALHKRNDGNHNTQLVGHFAGGMSGNPAYGPTPASSALHTREFQQPSRQLFVGNIGHERVKGDLFALFSPFGEIETIKDFPDRGYAFVIFRSIHDAIWAREQMNMYPVAIGNRTLVVNFGKRPANHSNSARSSTSSNSGYDGSLSNGLTPESDPEAEEYGEHGQEDAAAEDDVVAVDISDENEEVLKADEGFGADGLAGAEKEAVTDELEEGRKKEQVFVEDPKQDSSGSV